MSESSPIAPTRDLIVGLTDATKYVSHYTKIETALEYILPNRLLRLGTFARTNDPRETKAWKFVQRTFKPTSDRSAFQTHTGDPSLALTTELKHCARLFCSCADQGPLTGTHINDIAERGLAKPRMWHQYGNEHKGICLVFDRESLHERIVAKFACRKFGIAAGPVKYRNRHLLPGAVPDEFSVNIDFLNQVGTRKFATDHLTRWHQPLFFEKMEDWRDENEYRWVVWGNTTDDLYVDYGNALKGVIFGENVRRDLAEAVMGFTANDDVEWKRLFWENGSPWYDYGNPIYDRDIRLHCRLGQPPLPSLRSISLEAASPV